MKRMYGQAGSSLAEGLVDLCAGSAKVHHLQGEQMDVDADY